MVERVSLDTDLGEKKDSGIYLACFSAVPATDYHYLLHIIAVLWTW